MSQETAAPLRILFLGENWFGSCARACSYALRRLGHNVMDVDSMTFFPQAGSFAARAGLRLMRGTLAREYNQRIVQLAAEFRPDLLLAFKGPHVTPDTLVQLRRAGVARYNYFPDRVFLYRSTPLAESLPEYDCVFDTKRYWDNGVEKEIQVRRRVYLPHGYDPELHRPPGEVDPRFEAEVSFVGNHSPLKETLLAGLVSISPGVGLRIWGHHWRERCAGTPLARYVAGPAVTGADYARAIGSTRVNLALMGVTAEARDETTTRTYEIPACGGFMLHERSEELLQLFDEGTQVACFGSAEELAEKIDHYLAHPDEREAVARAGHARCVPAYAYDRRMAEIVGWHTGRGAEQGRGALSPALV